MKVLTPGHKYELANHENKDAPGQLLQFIEKQREHEESVKFITVNDGTTNEEVLAMLIDRLDSLYQKLPSEETADALKYCKMALQRLEDRTRDRQARGVEATPLA
jgi:hypothetical protein